MSPSAMTATPAWSSFVASLADGTSTLESEKDKVSMVIATKGKRRIVVAEREYRRPAVGKGHQGAT
jgi:hypothetical protein